MLLAVSLEMQKGSNRNGQMLVGCACRKHFFRVFETWCPVVFGTLSIEIQFPFLSSRRGLLEVCQDLFNLCSDVSFFSRYTDNFVCTCVQLILTKPIQLCELMLFER